MEEKSTYTPQEVAIMLQKTHDLESALHGDDVRRIVGNLEEFRQNVPENVRNYAAIFLEESYVEKRAVDKVAI